MRNLLLLLATFSFFAVGESQSPLSVQFNILPNNLLELRNGFCRLIVNLNRGSLDLLQGRFEGDGNFEAWNLNDASPNLAPSVARNTNPLALPTGLRQGSLAVLITGDGVSLRETSTSSYTYSAPLTYTVLGNTSTYASFTVNNLQDSPTNPRITASLSFSLAYDSRALIVNVSATASQTFNATAVRINTAWSSVDGVALFTTGIRQAMLASQSAEILATPTPWKRYYSMGYTGSVDILPLNPSPMTYGSLMFASEWNGQRTGFDIVLAGNVVDNGWMDGLESWTPTTVQQNTQWNVAFTITPNNYDFPASAINISGPVTKMDINDIRSILTGVYGSPMSALHSHDYSPEARIAPCIEREGNDCYTGMYNFFDPDSFLSVGAMLWSFDPDVYNQVRLLIETNLRFLCPADAPASRCTLGQSIHHFVPSCNAGDPKCVCTLNPINPFVVDCVTYAAISGAIQTGPNIFLMFSALRYAAISGNTSWLQLNMNSIRFSADFLLNAFDETVGLLCVGNSLWIDTFIRANYTTDTNAAAILLFQLMSDAEASLGNTTGSTFYSNLANTIQQNMIKVLWSPEGNHFCTQSDPAPAHVPPHLRSKHGSNSYQFSNNSYTLGLPYVPCTRDFIDYDSNLLAVAAGAVTGAQAQALLTLVDSGPCTHQHATWVSGIYYDAKNCNSGNTGDSAVSMGRISWADALARKAMGDAANAAVFNNLILNPIQYELLSNTWLNERYQCSGLPAHNDHYIEQPEVVGMMLVEAKYGISIGFTVINVDPIFGFTNWDFSPSDLIHIGYYNSTSFTASFALLSGNRNFTVTKMVPGTYTVTPSNGNPFQATVANDGILSFGAVVGQGISVTAIKTG